MCVFIGQETDDLVMRGDNMPHTNCSAVKSLVTSKPSIWPSIVLKNSLKDLLSSFTGFIVNIVVKWWFKIRRGWSNSR